MSQKITFKVDKAFKGALSTIRNKSNDYNENHQPQILSISLELDSDTVTINFRDEDDILILSGDEWVVSYSSAPSSVSSPPQIDILHQMDVLNAKMDNILQTIPTVNNPANNPPTITTAPGDTNIDGADNANSEDINTDNTNADVINTNAATDIRNVDEVYRMMKSQGTTQKNCVSHVYTCAKSFIKIMRNDNDNNTFEHPDIVGRDDHRVTIRHLFETLPSKMRDYTTEDIKTMFKIGYYAIQDNNVSSWESSADIIRACRVFYELVELVVSNVTNSHDWKYHIKDGLFNAGIYPAYFRDLNTKNNWKDMKPLIKGLCEIRNI
jgi:hypothetical protein